MPVPGIDQGSPRVRRYRIPTDSVFVPTSSGVANAPTWDLPGISDLGALGEVGRLGWSTVLIGHNPFDPGECFLMPGPIDPRAQQSGTSPVLTDAIDVALFGSMKLRRPVTQFSLFSLATHAGDFLDITWVDGEIWPLAGADSGGAVDATIVSPLVGGRVDVNIGSPATLPVSVAAVVPTNVYGVANYDVDASAWHSSAITAAGPASSLLAAAAANRRGVLLSLRPSATDRLFLRRDNAVTANQGLAPHRPAADVNGQVIYVAGLGADLYAAYAAASGIDYSIVEDD